MFRQWTAVIAPIFNFFVKPFSFSALFLLIAVSARSEVVVELVKDINKTPNPDKSSYSFTFTEYNGRVYFGADDGVHGHEVWVHDELKNTTGILNDLYSGVKSALGGNLVTFNEKLYFVGTNDEVERGLWVYDDNTNEAILVTNEFDYPIFSGLSDLFVSDNSIFSIEYSQTQNRLVEIDPINKELVKDLILPNEVYIGLNSTAVYRDNLYFVRSTPEFGQEVWVWNEQGASLVSDIASGVGGSNPHMLKTFKDKLYFDADEGLGYMELWVFDADTGSTTKIRANNETTIQRASENKIGYQDKLYFSGLDQDGINKIWVHDPLLNSTEIAQDVSNYMSHDRIDPVGVIGDALYFMASDGNNLGEFWSYVETTNTITFHGSFPIESHIEAWTSQVVGSKIYFSNNDGIHGYEPWMFDTEKNSISILKDVHSSSEGSYAENFIVYDDKLLFLANDGNSYGHIWAYDKITDETTKLIGEYPEGEKLSIDRIVAHDGILYFYTSHKLYSYDKDSKEIKVLFSPSNRYGFSSTEPLVVNNNKLFFQFDDPASGREIWSYDIESKITSLVFDVAIGASDSSAGDFFGFDNKIFFTANDRINGEEVWVHDSILNTTYMLKDIYPGSSSSYPSYFKVYNEKLYFVATDDVSGKEIWRYDPKTEVLDLAIESKQEIENLRFVLYSAFDGDFYLRYAEQSYPYRAHNFIYNEESGSLTPDSRFQINGLPFLPSSISKIGNKGYVIVDTTEYGRELWSYDYETAESYRVTDIYPESGDSSPSKFTVYDNRLFFRANSPQYGIELWSLAETQPPEINYPSELASITMSEDSSPIPFSLLLEASDPNGDPLTWSISEQAASGIATASGNGLSKDINYIPKPNFHGEDFFTVQVSDGILSDTLRVKVVVEEVNDLPQGEVLISGNPIEDHLLMVTDTLTDIDGMGDVSYQWYRNEVVILSATEANYQLSQSDVGQVISVVAIYTDGQNNLETVSSLGTLPVANVNDPLVGSVSIRGNAFLGQRLSVAGVAELSDEDGIQSIEYEWLRNGMSTGIAASELLLSEQDVNAQISVQLTVKDTFGNSHITAGDPVGPIDDDTDGDGIPNKLDEDDDNDGVPDSLDDFPLDNSETIDSDGDGVGDNADTDTYLKESLASLADQYIDLAATGLLTDIESFVQLQLDAFDAELLTLIEIQGESYLESGNHEIVVTVENVSGDTIVSTLNIRIFPYFVWAVEEVHALQGEQKIITGGLSGESPVYPVTGTIEVQGDVQIDVETFTLYEETNFNRYLTVSDVTGIASLSVANLTNAVLNESKSTLEVLVLENQLPRVSTLALSSNGTSQRILEKASDQVLSFRIEDEGYSDLIAYVTIGSDLLYSGIIEPITAENQYEIPVDLSDIANGNQDLILEIKETNSTDRFAVRRTLPIYLVDELPTLSSNDADEDGITDDVEGYEEIGLLGQPAYLTPSLSADTQIVNVGNKTLELTNTVIETEQYQVQSDIFDEYNSIKFETRNNISVGSFAFKASQGLPSDPTLDLSVFKQLNPNFVELSQFNYENWVLDLTLIDQSESHLWVELMDFEYPNGLKALVVDNDGIARDFIAAQGNDIKYGGDCRYLAIELDTLDMLDAEKTITCLGLIVTDGGPNDRDGLINNKVDLTLLLVRDNALPEIQISGPTKITGGDNLVLSASQTIDVDEQELTFLWKQVAGDIVLIEDEVSASELNILTDLVSEETVVKIELSVSDGKVSVSMIFDVILIPEEETGSLYWYLVLIALLVVGRRQVKYKIY